jgi:GNAT superfamily N-acetyltransferase
MPSERRTTCEYGYGYRSLILLLNIPINGTLISVHPDYYNAINEYVDNLDSARILDQSILEYFVDAVRRISNTSDKIGIKRTILNTVTHHSLKQFNVGSLPRSIQMRQIQEQDKHYFWPYTTAHYDLDLFWEHRLQSVKHGTCFGILENDKVLSYACTNSQDMMTELLSTVSFETLPEERRKGYGTAVLSATTTAILDSGKAVLGDIVTTNIASNKTSIRLGYFLYANKVQIYDGLLCQV